MNWRSRSSTFTPELDRQIDGFITMENPIMSMDSKGVFYFRCIATYQYERDMLMCVETGCDAKDAGTVHVS